MELLRSRWKSMEVFKSVVKLSTAEKCVELEQLQFGAEQVKLLPPSPLGLHFDRHPGPLQLVPVSLGQILVGNQIQIVPAVAV